MSSQKKKKTKAPIFALTYFGIVALFLIGLMVAWIVLRNTLVDYENSMPQYVMENIKHEFSNQDFTDILQSSNIQLSTFETQEQFKETITSQINGQELSYKKSSDYSTTHPVYSLIAGDKQIATVSLKEKSEKSKHGFKLWQLESINPNITNSQTVKILAPQNITVSINGVAVGQEFIKQNNVTIPALAEIPDDIMEKPVMVEYEITGLLQAPKITASDANGTQCMISTASDDGSYTVSYPSNSNLESELSEQIIDIAKSYSKYMSNDMSFWNLSKYISQNVPLYNNLSAVLTYFYADHSSYDFQNLTSSNFTVYSDSCISYDVSFDYIITMYDGTSHTYPTELTLVMIKEGEEWKLGSLITGNAGEQTTGDDSSASAGDDSSIAQ